MPARQAEKNNQAKKTILIVEDHPLVRLGLTSLIEAEPDLVVCGEVGTCEAAHEAIRASAPDLVIVDLVLDGCNGLDLVKTMHAHYPEIPALVLSMHDEAVYAERALRAGARGYVTKKQFDETVLLAIRRVLSGETYLSQALEARFAQQFLAGRIPIEDSPLATLTDRQLEVFRLFGEGKTTRQIAQTLHLSIKTIESHVEHLKHKLMLDSSVELIHHATQWVDTGRVDTGRVDTGRAS
ncbi:MAG: response regulator [Gammaproteobacteria bacterium]